MLHLSFTSYFLILAIFLFAVSGQWIDDIDQHLWRYPMALFILMIIVEWKINKQRTPELTIKCPERPRLGQAFHAEISIRNPLNTRLLIQSRQSLPEALTGGFTIMYWNLPAQQSQSQTLTLNTQALGNVSWKPTYIRVKGMFGLVWWERKLLYNKQLEIIPDFLDHKERIHGTDRTGQRQSRLSGSGFELLSIRDYRHGDPMRSIDWKASAKNRKHMVRVMTQEQSLDMLILLDIGRYSSYQAGSLSRLHHVVNIAARLSEKAILNGDSVGMITFADKVYTKLKPNNTTSNLTRIRKTLIDLQAVMHEPNLLLACYEGLKLLSQRSLIVILTDLERKDNDGQLIKSVNLLGKKHLAIVASIINEELIHRKNKPAHEWLDPYHGLAAREMLKSIQDNRVHLQRNGVQTVATIPSQLDDRVLKSYELARAHHQV